MISYCWKPHLEYHKSAGTSKGFIDGVTKLSAQGVNFNESSFKLLISIDSIEIIRGSFFLSTRFLFRNKMEFSTGFMRKSGFNLELVD